MKKKLELKKGNNQIVLTFNGFANVLPSTNDQFNVRCFDDERPDVPLLGRGYVGKSFSLHKIDD